MDMDNYDVIERALPLFNKTAVFLYTLCDFLKPGPSDVLQSALPLYQLILISTVFVVWLVVFLYYWKLVYYVVDDPYATPYGPAPPNKRHLDVSAYEKILGYIYGKW